MQRLLVLNRTFEWVLVIAVSALAVALLGNFATAFAARKNCNKIELINERVRSNAINNYNETVIEQKARVVSLDEEAKLLGITVTPELRARVAKEAVKETEKALRDRDDVLRQYATQECHLFNLG